MITVIVPVYNVESYLHQCIDSILCQTYQELEILLIDDGSPDKCGEICEEYARKDTRIRVFHTGNKGLSAARNLGLREAKGEYIGFVDSDDWLEPNMYEILLRRLEETKTNISACGVWKEFLNKNISYSNDDGVYYGTETIRALLHLSNGMWNKLYKKDYWSDICYPENHIYEEIATLHKVLLKANSLSCVPKPLYHYRTRDGSIVHSRSMNTIMDYWSAFYDRYAYLCAFPQFNNDSEIRDILEKQIAFAAVRMWIWVYRIPKEQRDYVFLHKASAFVQKHFPLFGKSNWQLSLRVAFVLCRYTNDASFAALYVPNTIHSFFRNMLQKPFPSSWPSDGMLGDSCILFPRLLKWIEPIGLPKGLFQRCRPRSFY